MPIDTRIILSALWITVMFTYLLGDVLRLYSGDAQRMLEADPLSSAVWMGAAVLMLIPILMIWLSLVLPYDANRWANILVAIGWILFNLASLNGYPSAYDRFLLLVSVVFNGVTIWTAWNWS